MRLLSMLFGLILALPLWANPISAPQLLQLVDYVGVDYEEAVGKKGKIKNLSEYQEMQEFSTTILGAVEALPESEKKASLVAQAHELQQLVNSVAPVSDVRVQTAALTKALRSVLTVTLVPSQTPEVALGKSIYQEKCVSCHGVTGKGDGVLAKSLEPAPTNFHDNNRMDQLSLFALYNTITLGVEGTGMVSYAKTLTENERWSLAFYISSLVDSDKSWAAGEKAWEAGKKSFIPDLTALTTTTASMMNEQGNDARHVLAYLRAHPGALKGSDPFVVTLAELAKSMKSYEANDAKSAYQYALAAYLDGFETAEPVLDVLDHENRLFIEKKMMAYREAVKSGKPLADVKVQYAELVEILKDVQKSLPTTEFSDPAVFFSALVILLREGLESILIVGMLIVMLIKGEKRNLLPVVHAGWILALFAGALTWWASHTLITITGAMRELTEGVTAFIAAGMLLYVGIWIHRNQLARDWRVYLQEKFSKHVNKEAMWGLGALSFLAVYRELFETVLFYEALGLQVGAEGLNMIWLGIGVALAILLTIVFLMVRFGLQLPLQSFFRVSAWLIFLFAIIFVGQGVHGLEEAGKVPVWTANWMPTIQLLGIYPNLFGVALQAVVAGFAGFYLCRGK
ncbi:MAG: FTR1 family protein [Gammaproteobacteria bacterium]